MVQKPNQTKTELDQNQIRIFFKTEDQTEYVYSISVRFFMVNSNVRGKHGPRTGRKPN